MLIFNSACFQGTPSHNLHPLTVGIGHGLRKQMMVGFWNQIIYHLTGNEDPILLSGAQIALDTGDNMIIEFFIKSKMRL